MSKLLNLDYETCQSVAKQYKSMREFQKKDSSIFTYAQEKGWLDKLFPTKRHIKEEDIVKAAGECKDKDEFRLKYPDFYRSATNRGILPRLFHEEDFSRLTYDDCQKVATLFKNRVDFRVGARREWMKSKCENWIDDFFPKYTVKKDKSPVANLSDKTILKKVCMQAAKKYEYLENFKKHDPINYKRSVDNDFIKDFIWLKTGKWTPKSKLKH